MSAAPSFLRQPGLLLVCVTGEILKAPFGFALAQAERPPHVAREYLFSAGGVFLVAMVLSGLGAVLWPDGTLLVAQSVLVGLAVLALLAGNGAALLLSRFSSRPADLASLLPAGMYASGFALVWLSVFRLVGLVGPALMPGYSGSLYEGLTVLAGMSICLFGVFLMLDWPRRVTGVDEGAYYAVVAGAFLVVGVLLRLAGLA